MNNYEHSLIEGHYRFVDKETEYKLKIGGPSNSNKIFGDYFSYSETKITESGGIQVILKGHFDISGNEITLYATQREQESWITLNGEDLPEGEAMVDDVQKQYTAIFDTYARTITINMSRRILVFTKI